MRINFYLQIFFMMWSHFIFIFYLIKNFKHKKRFSLNQKHKV